MKRFFSFSILLFLLLLGACKSAPADKNPPSVAETPAETAPAPVEPEPAKEQEPADPVKVQPQASESAKKAEPAKKPVVKEPAKTPPPAAKKPEPKKKPEPAKKVQQPVKPQQPEKVQKPASGTAAQKQPEKKPVQQKPQEPAYVSSTAITDISWMIEQADRSFVSKRHTGEGKIFVTVLAKYTGELTAKDFYEASIFSPRDMWTLDAQNAKGIIEIDKKNKLLILKHLASGDGEGSAALGSWFASITLAGQKPFEKELTVTGIGGQTVRLPAEKPAVKGIQKKKLYPLIVPTAQAPNEQQALAVPVIHSVSRDADTIEIIFSVTDSRVKNGYFYFDVPGEEYYRDSGSLIDAAGKPVNGCRSFSVDGKKCQYVLRKDASNKDWFGKATRCFFVVSDINRVASPWEERHRSISPYAPVLK
ncbi:MAG: hypothetical protein P1P65_07705 [Treponema sp.]